MATTSFGDTLTRTLRDPLAWGSAITVAYVGTEPPAAWIADALGLTHGTTLLDALTGFRKEDAAASWIGLVLLAWLVRLPVVAATLVAAGQARGSSLELLQKYATRVVRTRGIATMVTAAFAVIPLYLLAAWRQRAGSPMGPDLGIAITVAFCSGWLALADRFAFSRFDARQDQVASDAREEGQSAGTYYRNTGNPGRGRGVASGADNAVTDAGWALLSTSSLVAIVVGLALDLAVVLVLSSVVGYVPSVAVRVAAGAIAVIVTATVWTHVFARTSRS